MNKIPVYFMPGLAAGPAIFERIQLPPETFEMHFLEWEIPLKKESLCAYAEKMAKHVSKEGAVLVGVSFGGVLVQEMSKFLHLRKLIIISSVKCNQELPKRMKVTKFTKAYKLFPIGLVNHIGWLNKISFGGSTIHNRLKLYEKFLAVRDKTYLEWAIEQVIVWDRKVPDTNVIHIHGDADAIFPVRNIKNCIKVPGGTHIMILNKYRWFNENLPKIILG